jgi:hypothetical protein
MKHRFLGHEQEDGVSITWVLALLVAAFVIVFLTYAIRYPSVGAKLSDRMGAGDWKFTESWASTVTNLGGILTVVLAAQLLPSDTDTQKLIKGAYVVYGLMFAATVVVGTAVYNTFRIQNRVAKPTQETPKPGETPSVEPPSEDAPPATIQYQGFVGFFLVACALILWAVLGQLLSVWYLLGEVPNLAASVYNTFKILLGLGMILALIYIPISVPWTLRNQAYHDEIGTGPEKQQQARVRSNFYFP